MPSCFKCAVVDQLSGTTEPIGVCAKCNSLACYDHGTRLRQSETFRCAICLSPAMLNAAGIVTHDDYSQAPGRGDGGVAAEGPTVSPAGGGGRGRALTHAEFEVSLLTARVAENSASHRGHANKVVDDLLAFVRTFPEAQNQSVLVARMAVTSDEATQDRIRDAGLSLSRDVRSAADAQQLEPEIVADAMGVATWAIGVDPRGEVPLARIELIPDERVQFVLLAWSRIFAFA